MKIGIGLRMLFGYFVIVALAALLLTQVFLQQVKPGVRQAMEDSLVETANLLAELAAEDMKAGHIAQGRFAAGVRAVRERDLRADIWGHPKHVSELRVTVTESRGVVVFDSEGKDVGRDHSQWNDVLRTLRGQYGARSTRDDPNDAESSVMHVAAPVYDDARRLVGVLSVAKPNRVLAPFIVRSRRTVLGWGLVLLGSAALVGVMTAWWMSRQLGAIRSYADAVKAGERATVPEVAGEFGDLARALHEMRERLEGKQYVEQYVHALTHELKGPLAAIRSAAELLEGPLPEDDRARFVASVQAQSDRLAQMVDKLLALAEVEYRQRIEQPQRLLVGALMTEAAEALRGRADAAGISLAVELPTELAVKGDAFLLRQALCNLLDNALDFAPRGSRVEARVAGEGAWVNFTVADRGPGVPDYALPRVFERFYSLPRPDGGSRSSGLGLPFVAQVAQLHGGSAVLRNREGGGALAVLALRAA